MPNSLAQPSHMELIPFPRPFPGIPAEFWIKNIDIVRNFIEKNQLKPLNQEELIRIDRAERTTEIRYLEMKEGGMRSPHLHYKGERYLLNPDQWRSFTRPIVAGFAERLAAAEHINFDSLLEVDSALNKIV